jgi:hypothetical protein
MNNLIAFQEYFRENDGMVFTHENIFMAGKSIKNKNFRIVGRSGQNIALSDISNNLGAKLQFEDKSFSGLYTVRSQIFYIMKEMKMLEFQQSNYNVGDEFKAIIDAFMKDVKKCKKIAAEFYERDISAFKFGFVDKILFIASENDKELLSVVEYNSGNFIFRDYGFGYNSSNDAVLVRYVEISGRKLKFEFDLDEHGEPVLTVKTYLSARIIDSDYRKYSHEFFEKLFLPENANKN